MGGILPLSGFGLLALSFFLVDTVVNDVLYTKDEVNGIDVISEPTPRTIQAAVDPANKEKLENIFGGNIGDGSIGIYTQEVLYMQDQGDVNQSYVIDGGKEYRVKARADWTLQMGFYVYLAERHIPQPQGV
jgi:hypothetical protein